MGHLKHIDLDHWDRKEHFLYFRTMDYPQFNVCAPADVTALLGYAKKEGLPFYYVMIFAATEAANQIGNFRFRIRDGGVIEHDRLHPSFTALDENTGLFKYVTADMGDDLAEFAAAAREKARQQKGLFGDGSDEARDDVVYLTCLPWVSFTHISHTISLNKDDSIPRISWGKYYAESGRTLLPLSVQVNHALADGYHIGQYFLKLQEILDSWGNQ